MDLPELGDQTLNDVFDDGELENLPTGNYARHISAPEVLWPEHEIFSTQDIGVVCQLVDNVSRIADPVTAPLVAPVLVPHPACSRVPEPVSTREPGPTREPDPQDPPPLDRPRSEPDPEQPPHGHVPVYATDGLEDPLWEEDADLESRLAEWNYSPLLASSETAAGCSPAKQAENSPVGLSSDCNLDDDRSDSFQVSCTDAPLIRAPSSPSSQRTDLPPCMHYLNMYGSGLDASRDTDVSQMVRTDPPPLTQASLPQPAPPQHSTSTPSANPPSPDPEQLSGNISPNLNISAGQNLNFRVLGEEARDLPNLDAGILCMNVLLDEPPTEPTSGPETYGPWLHHTLAQLIHYCLVKGNVRPQDKVQLEIFSFNVENKPLFITPRRGDQLSPEIVFQRIEKVLNSNEDFLLSGPLRIKFCIKRSLVGYARVPMGVNLTMSHKKFVSNKRGIVNIPNNDGLCLARAIVVGRANAHKTDCREALKEYKSICNIKNNVQERAALQLCDLAGVDLSFGGSIDEVGYFQNSLPDYTITVFDDRRGTGIAFEGPPSTDAHPRRFIDLFYEDGHFVTISNLKGLLGKNYCRACKTPYQNLIEHKCKLRCPQCLNETKCKLNDRGRFCDDCHRFFLSGDCYDNHLKVYSNKKTVCELIKRCPDCQKVYGTLKRKNVPHTCDEVYCGVCSKFEKRGHKCFVQKQKDEKNPSKKGFMVVFYDLECRQSTPTGKEGEFWHEANLCVSRQYCNNCLDIGELEECDHCGIRENVFEGTSCVKDFITHLREPVKHFPSITCVAHYGSGYDFHFLLRYLAVEQGWTPSMISNGAKLMRVKFGNLTFIDSLNFLCAPLSKLPKMMSIEGDLDKGYFPHLFNRPENEGYVGPMPPVEMYTPDDMKEDGRNKFLAWYNQKVEEGYVFDFDAELVFYCKLDVEILAKSCLKFRDLFLKETTIDPFRECVTIASSCMKTYLKLFYEPKTIPIIPKGGYRCVDNQSMAALLWLDWVAHSKNLNIRHAGNGREVVPPGLRCKVDGFVPERKLIFEFYGCFFHGCEKCKREGRDRPIANAPDETFNLRFQRTLHKESAIAAIKGPNNESLYTLVSIWECDWERIKNSDENVKAFCLNAKADYLVPPLVPKDAFFGGRTNAVKLFKEVNVEAGETIHYYDVCSLYPWVCKYGEFTVGHPLAVWSGSECEGKKVRDIKGLIKCKVLPPNSLYHPVLPYRCGGKLAFPLCRTCVETSEQNDCYHTDEERCITGTWVSLELQKAEELGYHIVKIYEIWHYQTTKYDRETKTGGLFDKYVNKFLKLKQEASGWPEWCVTEEDKKKYIEEYELKEDIRLDPNNIKKNEGFRSIAKLCLNSHWGKFGERDNFTEAKLYSDPDEISAVFEDPSIDVLSFHPISDSLMLVTTKSTEETIIPGKKSNVVIAAFVTAQARLKLYSYLQQLQYRVLYFDTDSVLYTRLPHEPLLPTGDHLGDLTDELLKDYGPGSYIAIFVSGGPKNYAFLVAIKGDRNKTATVCKVRGICLNYRASKKVNFESVKRSVLNNIAPIVVPIPYKIVRRPEWKITTVSQEKIYRVVYTKRRRLEGFDTLPFGTKRTRQT